MTKTENTLLCPKKHEHKLIITTGRHLVSEPIYIYMPGEGELARVHQCFEAFDCHHT